MYLKTLELLGFKSFAERTVIQFHEGITAIVGPNGCGKSNVLDAVRWVLGEQSAKALRGGEMIDVIFGGTDERKALNMAEVSLTFADCEKELGVDWSEVRVTRRVFRDGKSEYLLNNVGCRLRDIQGLFMDTGIGRAAYSIMEQGKIDLILSSRPEDRRAVFEEAAGITKYKAQKREALRKLEHTEANLVRVGDIIREVKRQIGSLQRQAGKARRYKTLLADVQVLDTHLNRVKYEGFAAERTDIERRLQSLDAELDEHQERLADSESVLAAERLALEEIETRATTARDKVQQLQSNIQNRRSRIEFNRERAIEFRALIGRHTEEIAEAQRRLEEQRVALGSLQTALEEAERAAADVDEDLRRRHDLASESLTRRREAEMAFETLRQKVVETENRMLSLRAEIAGSRSMNEAIDARLMALDEEKRVLRSDADGACHRLDEARVQWETAKASLQDLKQRGEDAAHHLAAQDTEVAAARDTLESVEREIAALEMRRDTLRHLNESGDGAGDGARQILEGLDEPARYRAGVLGVLANLIDVESRYAAAVDTALGGRLDTVMLHDGASIMERIIELAAEGRLPRAAVAPLPLSAPEVQAVRPPYGLPSRALCYAADVVQAPPLVADFVSRALSATAIAPDLASARAIWRETGCPVATLTGEFIGVDGVHHIGSQGSSEQSTLARKAQIASLEREIDALRPQQAEALSQVQRATEETTALRSELEQLRDDYQESRVAAGMLERQVQECERELGAASARMDALEREAAQQSSRQHSALEKISGVESKLSADNDAIEIARRDLDSAAGEVDVARERETADSAAVNEARVQAATARQRLEGLAARRTPLDERIAELEQQIAARGHDVASYEERIRAAEDENTRLTDEIAGEEGALRSAQEEVAAVLQEREAAGAKISEAGEQLRAIRDVVDRLRHERGRHEVRQTQTALHVDNLREHVMRRYRVDIGEFRSDTYLLHKTLDQVKKKRQRNAAGSEDDTADQVSESDAAADFSTSEFGDQQVSDSAEDVREEFDAGFSDSNADDAGISERAASDNPTEQPIDWELVEELVGELTRKLDAMGPVNLDAIEEFAELEERHTFLLQQNDDLIRAKDELLTAIARINKTTEELFAETFARLRENFAYIFRELFGGGKADLALMDSSNPLECGIEIVAKPPGKQPQAISLLSGGERAMTAVALLFAIYMVKPSPFCILDEMDAPLDDSNISRFVRLLERFAEQSQFVVISHNKRTIAKADYLYGVTMERKGVSKLVGVRFARTADEAADGPPSNGATLNEESPGISDSFGKSDRLLSEEAGDAVVSASAES